MSARPLYVQWLFISPDAKKHSFNQESQCSEDSHANDTSMEEVWQTEWPDLSPNGGSGDKV